MALFIVQILNGLQLGVLLFLIAAGLTLVFGVMNFINLAHGVQYMLGAYLAVMFYAITGSSLLAVVLAMLTALVFGLFLEFAIFRHLYDRDHLEQVIATFGIIIFLNQAVKTVWGAAPLTLPIPEIFSGTIVLMPGLLYPVWRLVIIGSGLAVGLLLYLLVSRTRVGMLVRAGATNAQIVSALGVDIRRTLHDRVRIRHHARRLRRRDDRANPFGRARHGRHYAHPCLRRHRHRRYRIDTRRIPRRSTYRPR